MDFWLTWLAGSGLQEAEVANYAHLFADNGLLPDDVPSLTHELLSSMGVLKAKHRLLILAHKRKLAAAHARRAQAPKKAAAAADDDVDDDGMQAQIVAHLKQSEVMLEEANLLQWVRSKWELCTREGLVEKGYIEREAPKQGLSLIADNYRTEAGEKLLFETKAVLWAALYGETETQVRVERVERELLALTVPVKKAHVFNFFESVTQIGVSGTWRDPEGVSSDEDAANMVLQVEYGETASELIGDTIMVCIILINLLQVNEEILYATSANVEQSTLKIQLHFKSPLLA